MTTISERDERLRGGIEEIAMMAPRTDYAADEILRRIEQRAREALEAQPMTAERTCDCDHGERNTRCGAPTTTWHLCFGRYLNLCDPCNTECHNRESERW